jgi:Flp pilus assembly CpaF family ATPase
MANAIAGSVGRGLERRDEVNASDLLRNALRMRPDRIMRYILIS